MISTAAELRALRKSIGSQAYVAQLLGLHRWTVGEYENRGRWPKWYPLALERLVEKQPADVDTPAGQA